MSSTPQITSIDRDYIAKEVAYLTKIKTILTKDQDKLYRKSEIQDVLQTLSNPPAFTYINNISFEMVPRNSQARPTSYQDRVQRNLLFRCILLYKIINDALNNTSTVYIYIQEAGDQKLYYLLCKFKYNQIFDSTSDIIGSEFIDNAMKYNCPQIDEIQIHDIIFKLLDKLNDDKSTVIDIDRIFNLKNLMCGVQKGGYKRTQEKVDLKGKSRSVYVGTRGGKYIKFEKRYRSLKTL